MRHNILWDLGKMRKGKYLFVSRLVLLGTNKNKNPKQPPQGPGSFSWLQLGFWGHLYLAPLLHVLVPDLLQGLFPPIKSQQEHRLGGSHPESTTDTLCGFGQGARLSGFPFSVKSEKIITTF